MLKKYLFDTFVLLPHHLYGVEFWGGSISISTWRKFGDVQKCVLVSFFQFKMQTLHSILLGSSSLPIEIMIIERVVEYVIKIQNGPPH